MSIFLESWDSIIAIQRHFINKTGLRLFQYYILIPPVHLEERTKQFAPKLKQESRYFGHQAQKCKASEWFELHLVQVSLIPKMYEFLHPPCICANTDNVSNC